jgi:hypothetical protein
LRSASAGPESYDVANIPMHDRIAAGDAGNQVIADPDCMGTMQRRRAPDRRRVLGGRAGRGRCQARGGSCRRVDGPGSGTPAMIMSGNPDEGALFAGVRPVPLPPGRGVLVRRRIGNSLVQVARSAQGT